MESRSDPAGANQLLLENGAIPDARDADGETPIDWHTKLRGDGESPVQRLIEDAMSDASE